MLTDLEEQIVTECSEEDRTLAEAFHKKWCQIDHTDRCTWEWDEHHLRTKHKPINWGERDRRQWLLRAHAAREQGFTSVEQIETLQATLNSITGRTIR